MPCTTSILGFRVQGFGIMSQGQFGPHGTEAAWFAELPWDILRYHFG